MKVKLLKRVRKRYRIVKHETYIKTQSGNRHLEVSYTGERFDIDDTGSCWCIIATTSPDIRNCLREIHNGIKWDLRKMFSKTNKIWP